MAERVGLWTLERTLGEGAFGSVFLGVRPDGRRAAIKLFRSEPSRRVRRADIAAIAAVRHANIPELIEFGDAPDGRLYTATRYVAGESLRSRLARGPLPATEVAALGRALASALASLHARRLVHRDVKPENILLPESGALADAQLTDLWLMGELQSETNTTQAGVLVGTPAYMAPEQVTGGGLGPAADVWALGVVLFEAATAALPFAGASALDVMRSILVQAPPLARLPELLRDPIAHALQRDPAARPSADAFAVLLGAQPPAYAPPAAPSFDPSHAPPPAPSFSPSSAPSPAPSPSPSPVPASDLAPAAPARRSLRLPLALALALVAAAALAVAALLGWPAALAAAAGAAVGAAVVAFARRARTRPATAAAAQQTALLAADRAAVTRSVALAVDELVAASRADPRANWLTASMALVIDGYEATPFSDPAKRLDATLKVLDLMLQLERRMREAQAPWYVRHDKPVAFVGALGSAAAIWVGLSQNLLEHARPDALIRGCPTAPIAPGTRVVLDADGARSLLWSVDGRDVLVGATFRWPSDQAEPATPGVHVVRAAATGAGAAAEPSALCVIEVRR